MYHGILLDKSFYKPGFSESFNLFAKRKSKSNPWTIFGIELTNNELEKAIQLIQSNLRSDVPYYAHLYNDEELIAIFKTKVFRVSPHKATWEELLQYGKKLNIPEEQLDFWPNRFQDELHYFQQKDFVIKQ